MDQTILNQARNAYFLGNYGKVLEIWQSFDETNQSDLDYYYFIVSRALMAQKELKPKSAVQITKKPTQKLREITDLVIKYLLPLLKLQKPNSTINDDRKYIEDALGKITQQFNEKTPYFKIMQTICAYLSINSCEVKYALTIETQKNDPFSMEITFLQLTCFLRGRRFDLAEKKMMELKKIDDEDVLSYLGQIYSNFYSGSTSSAIAYISETKERFGDSAKLMNLMVNCLINSGGYLKFFSQNKFEEAFDLAAKLQQALLEKEQFSDRAEIETCLSNMVVLAEICGKPQVRDENLSALQAINPAAYILKHQAQLINQLEEEMKQ